MLASNPDGWTGYQSKAGFTIDLSVNLRQFDESLLNRYHPGKGVVDNPAHPGDSESEEIRSTRGLLLPHHPHSRSVAAPGTRVAGPVPGIAFEGLCVDRYSCGRFCRVDYCVCGNRLRPELPDPGQPYFPSARLSEVIRYAITDPVSIRTGKHSQPVDRIVNTIADDSVQTANHSNAFAGEVCPCAPAH